MSGSAGLPRSPTRTIAHLTKILLTLNGRLDPGSRERKVTLARAVQSGELSQALGVLSPLITTVTTVSPRHNYQPPSSARIPSFRNLPEPV